MSCMSPLRRESWTRVELHATSCVSHTDRPEDCLKFSNTHTSQWNVLRDVSLMHRQLPWKRGRCDNSCHGLTARKTVWNSWRNDVCWRTRSGERGRLSRLRPASQPHQHRRPRRRQALELPRVRLAPGSSVWLFFRQQPPVPFPDHALYVYVGARRASVPNHARDWNQ